MHSSSTLGLGVHSRRRRQQVYWRFARYGLVAAALGVTAAYAYQVGAAQTAPVIDTHRAEIED